jgi:hypothetical protein
VHGKEHHTRRGVSVDAILNKRRAVFCKLTSKPVSNVILKARNPLCKHAAVNVESGWQQTSQTTCLALFELVLPLRLRLQLLVLHVLQHLLLLLSLMILDLLVLLVLDTDVPDEVSPSSMDWPEELLELPLHSATAKLFLLLELHSDVADDIVSSSVAPPERFLACALREGTPE